MDIPYKQMFSWKTGNIGPTLIGIAYILLPFLVSSTVNPQLMLFGFTFLLIGLIRARAKPTVLGCIFAMLIGLSYFLGFTGGFGTTMLWAFSLILTGATFVFELGIWKIGPANAKAKLLLIVPLAIIGFSLLLAIAGYNPMITFSWSNWIVALDYVAVMLFCWINVVDTAGWRPLGKNTMLWQNLMAIATVALTVLSVVQGLAIVAP